MCSCSHSDVLSDSILYVQDDLESSSDDFEFVLYDVENVLRRQRAEIVVKPRLTRQQTTLRVTDQPVVIGLDLLDASQLKVSVDERHNIGVGEGGQGAGTCPLKFGQNLFRQFLRKIRAFFGQKSCRIRKFC